MNNIKIIKVEDIPNFWLSERYDEYCSHYLEHPHQKRNAEYDIIHQKCGEYFDTYFNNEKHEIFFEDNDVMSRIYLRQICKEIISKMDKEEMVTMGVQPFIDYMYSELKIYKLMEAV